MSRWNVMKTKPLNEKNVYFTYHGYRFISEWDPENEVYNNEIVSPQGVKYISGHNLDTYEFNRITSVDVCATTKNTLNIKEFVAIINRWEDYIKNGYR